MAVTPRALSHLQSLLDLTERADTQITALARTLRSVNEQIDAMLDDEDVDMREVLAESATGEETLFRLSRNPIIADSVVVLIDGQIVSADAYAVDAAQNAIVPLAIVPAGVLIEAKYRVAGLRTQIVELLETMPTLSPQDFLDRKAGYKTAIAWIENRGN